MRKLIMWNVITLDGYFEGKQNWDLSFHNSVWGREMEEFSIEQLHDADYLAFGRVTYEGMASYWVNEKGVIADFMNNIPKLVFSTTLTTATWNNSTLIGSNASERIKQLKQEKGKNIYVFGSADLSETFINDNLFDEYRIGIAPVILGSGRHLFGKTSPQSLVFKSTQPLETGGVILKYGVKA